MEKWVKIKESVYEVSNLGRIRNIKTQRIVKQHLTTKKYLAVALYINGKRERWSVHRLVAIYFLDNPENKPQVDHINRIKTDNNVINLRWVTTKENAKNKVTGVSLRRIEEIISLYNEGLNALEIKKKIDKHGIVAMEVHALV